ncbi:MAG TPA: hypothetical protein VGC22_07260 [Chitinophaga sp.]
MKHFFLCALALCSIGYGHAQTKSQLSAAETGQLFPPAVKARYGITFPVFRAFTYTDRSGTFYVLLTEAPDTIIHEQGQAPDTLHHAIKAICLQANGQAFTKNWEINDFINREAEETNILFWGKYCAFTDVDGDGLADPFIVYSTWGINHLDDGRTKIILYYKGQKVAIRHQNSITDDGRVMEVDQAFYALPATVQQQGRAILQKLVDHHETYPPAGWQMAMDQHTTKIR